MICARDGDAGDGLTPMLSWGPGLATFPAQEKAYRQSLRGIARSRRFAHVSRCRQESSKADKWAGRSRSKH